MSVRGRPVLVRVTVEFGGSRVRLFAVHTVAPFGGARSEWVEGLEALAVAVRDETRPVVLAGDFNA